jgi:mannose-6-phosphate isomerase
VSEAPDVFAIEGVIRHYAWGSHTAIPELLGQPVSALPAAELWFGAHPDDPSPVPSLDSSLDRVIAADPQRLLGAQAAARFAGRLPFLLKVLAAEHALSLQVHPTLEQARDGFADEDRRGVPRMSASRNYRDANHKPELICALTPFDALCGFRPVEQTLQLFHALDVAALEPFAALLAGPEGLRNCFTALLQSRDPASLITDVVAGCERVRKRPEFAAAARATLLAAADFPGDIGAVVALLLNPVRLQPGEAIYLAAGNVHAYLRGVGVEIMANSDNVLRCGLTPKHIDVAELVRITDFRPLDDPRFEGHANGVASVGFRPPVEDFRLNAIDLDGFKGSAAWGGQGPQIVLCTSGAVQVTVGPVSVALTPGHAAFVAAREAVYLLRGTGQVFIAEVGGET